MKFDDTEQIYGIHNMAGNAINKAELQHRQKMVMKKIKTKLFSFFVFLILFLYFPIVKQGYKMIDTVARNNAWNTGISI